jgi:HPt (histidine-containing phosphotransfer) domain-containing protein
MGFGCIDVQALEKLRTLGGGELLSKMVELFISHAEPAMRDAAAALAKSDLDTVRRSAHSLKSSAGNLGAIQVQDLADRIEHLAEDGKSVEIHLLMPDLENAYTKAKDLLLGETRQGRR